MELYASAFRDAAIHNLIKTLIGFARVPLKANETKTVNIDIATKSLRQYNNKKDDYEVYRGIYSIEAGSSSADIKQETTLKIDY